MSAPPHAPGKRSQTAFGGQVLPTKPPQVTAPPVPPAGPPPAPAILPPAAHLDRRRLSILTAPVQARARSIAGGRPPPGLRAAWTARRRCRRRPGRRGGAAAFRPPRAPARGAAASKGHAPRPSGGG